jgi:enoyl-CoA hydratase/carnithine racemase
LSEPVLLREKRGRVMCVTLNRPHVMNALNGELRKALTDFWHELREDESVAAAIVTGAGDKAFSSGRDFKETAEADSAGRQLAYERTRELGYPASVRIGKPVIAAVHGHCLAAGLMVAIGCDIRICTPEASFGNPQVKRGRGTRMPYRLAKAGLPRAVIMDMVLTGKPITGAQALQWGLVSRLVPKEQLLPTAWEIAETITQNSPLIVRGIKTAIEAGLLDLPINETEALWPSVTGMMNTSSKDAVEGARSFVEKRNAKFS